MPTYTFQCPRCQRTEEHILGMSQAEKFRRTCDADGRHTKAHMVRVIAPVAGIVRNPAVPKRPRG